MGCHLAKERMNYFIREAEAHNSASVLTVSRFNQVVFMNRMAGESELEIKEEAKKLLNKLTMIMREVDQLAGK